MFLVLWKSLQTNFPFTSNVGTNNDAKKVAYSKLSTLEKENEENGPSSSDMYRTGSSKSSHELGLCSENHNNGESDNRLMKHSFSMDWNRSSQRNSGGSWRRRKEDFSHPKNLEEDEEDGNGNGSGTGDGKQFGSRDNNKDKLQSHSKFISGIIFKDETSDADEEEKGFECDVCERTFPTAKRLSAHQDKKRHFGCLQCDSIFPSRENLELHRIQMNHFDLVSDCGSDTTSYDSDEEELLDGDISEDDQRISSDQVTQSENIFEQTKNPSSSSTSPKGKVNIFKNMMSM